MALSDKVEQEMKAEMRSQLCKRMRRTHPDTYGKGDCDGRSVVCGWCGCAIDELADIVNVTIAFDTNEKRKR